MASGQGRVIARHMVGYRKHRVDTAPSLACYAGPLRKDTEPSHGACKSRHGHSRRHRVEPNTGGARGLRAGHPPRTPTGSSAKSLHKQRGCRGTGSITRASKQFSASTYALKRRRQAPKRARTRIRPGPQETYTQKSTEMHTAMAEDQPTPGARINSTRSKQASGVPSLAPSAHTV